jgi:cytochrome b involved in lipid metabolism
MKYRMTTNTNENDITAENEEDRPMNDTTMPPPARPITTKPTTSATAPRRRPKSARFGLADWTRLLSASKDLAQRHGQPLRRNIPWSEIQQHSSIHDGWIVLKQKVYRLSPYLPYHPGGESILKGVLGKDATALFDKYHRWVNEEGLIGALLLGYLDPRSPRRNGDDDDDSDDDDDAATFPMPAAMRPKDGV